MLSAENRERSALPHDDRTAEKQKSAFAHKLRDMAETIAERLSATGEFSRSKSKITETIITYLKAGDGADVETEASATKAVLRVQAEKVYDKFEKAITKDKQIYYILWEILDGMGNALDHQAKLDENRLRRYWKVILTGVDALDITTGATEVARLLNGRLPNKDEQARFAPYLRTRSSEHQETETRQAQPTGAKSEYKPTKEPDPYDPSVS